MKFRYVARAALYLVFIVIAAAADLYAQRSPFYLTVDRSYSPQESPRIRLDFTKTRDPLLLRVLKAKDLESFLEGQLNISRSYEEPISRINPGHYFLRGINKARSPLDLLRHSLSVNFRKNFGGSQFQHPLMPSPRSPELVAAPREISIGAPAGFDVVREVVLDLQLGGQKARGLYDAWWLDDEYKFKIKQIELAPLADGVYLLQGVQGNAEAQALMQVSSLAVQVKQSTSQLLIRAVDRSGQPVAGAAVRYRDGRGKWIALAGATDAFGQMRFDNPEGTLDGKLLLHVSDAASRQAIIDTDFLPASVADNRVLIVTDRPIFKPGEEVYFKGTIREFTEGQLNPPQHSGAEVRYMLVRADGTEGSSEQSATLTEFGSFSGKLEIAPWQPPGLYRVISEVGGKRYSGEFRIQDYIKPTFYLELIERDPGIVPGRSFKFRFRARKYSGAVPADARYEVFVYRKKFESPQFVEEAGGGLAAGTDYFGAVRSAVSLAQPQRLYSSVEARSAAARSDGEGRYIDPYGNPWKDAPLIDRSGEVAVEIQLPSIADKELEQDWIYTVLVRALDAGGAQAVLSENIYSTQSEAVASIAFSKPVVSAEERSVTLNVQSSFVDGKRAPQARGFVDLHLEDLIGRRISLGKVPFTTDLNGACQVDIETNGKSGRVEAVAVLEAVEDRSFKRNSRSAPASVVFAAAGGQAVFAASTVELFSEKTILNPGERARVFAVLPSGDEFSQPSGESVVWETIAGDKIFESRARQLNGKSAWFDVEAKPEYGTGFYYSLSLPDLRGRYQEQTVSFRIIPKDKQFSVEIIPQHELAEPMKDFVIDFKVSDHTGAPASNAELSVNVVDRAVYAVQPEFRPAVFDFFYPLTRLNLSTFYSDDLQGYGYADQIKKPNFKLSAIKNRSLPIKRNMRDTAGWFPHVLTDSEGKASVTVQMPANLTEWLVTAIAIDRQGRVGEARSMYRSATDIGVEMRLPPATREGDVILGALEVTNSSSQVLPAAVSVSSHNNLGLHFVSSEGASEGRPDVSDLRLEPKRSLLVPVSIEAGAALRDSERIGLVKVAAGAPQSLQNPDAQATLVRYGGARDFEIALNPAAAMFRFPGRAHGQGALDFDLPLSGAVSEVNVQVSSGLLGATLMASSHLVQYPYGCAEQLVHSTIPNLVLLDLMQRADVKAKDIAALGLGFSIERAKYNAEVGVLKLSGLQKADGGFAFWGSETQPNFHVSLIVLRALKLAADLGVSGAAQIFGSGRQWIAEEAKRRKIPTERSLAAFELSHLAEIGVSYELDDEYMDFVRSVADDRDGATIQEMLAALKILQLQERHYYMQSKLERPDAKDQLTARLKSKLHEYDRDYWIKAVRQEIPELGFSLGRASFISAVLGTLHELKALDQETSKRFSNELLASLRNGWWQSTVDSGQVIFNLRSLLSEEAVKFAQDNAKNRSKKNIGVSNSAGIELGALKALPGGYWGKFVIEDPAGSGAQLQDWKQLRLSGMGASDFAAATIAARVPFGYVEPIKNGISVGRRLLRLGKGGSQEFDADEKLSLGDIVISEITLNRAVGPAGLEQAGSSFVVVEDGLPSFAEGVEDDRVVLADARIKPLEDTYWTAVKDTKRHVDRIERVLKMEPGSSITLYNVWRVAFAGKASLPPARAFDMYNEDVAGNSAAALLEVQ